MCPPELPGHDPDLHPPLPGCERAFCPAIYQPICVRCKHHGVTFQNTCELNSYNCKNNDGELIWRCLPGQLTASIKAPFSLQSARKSETASALPVPSTVAPLRRTRYAPNAGQKNGPLTTNACSIRTTARLASVS